MKTRSALRSVFLIAVASTLTLVVYAAATPLVAAPADTVAPAANVGPAGTKTFDAISDTYVDNCTPDNNYGAADVLYVGNDYSEFTCDMWLLLDFDLGSYPAGVVYRSASLHLYQHGEYAGDGAKTLGIYAASGAWASGSVTWNSRPGVFAFLDYGNVGTGAGWREYDVSTVVHRWLVGGVANHGFVIKTNTSGSWMRSYRSMNYGTGSPYRAYLEVIYDQPTATPTATRTATRTRTATSTATATRTPTATLPPTKTSTPTRTPTRTATLAPTKTPTNTQSPTPNTLTPTNTKSPIPNTPTRTPTPTAPAVCPDPYEPNDTSASASVLPLGTDLRAYICTASDSDYYRFAVSGAVEIHARLDNPAGGAGLAFINPAASYELTLFDPAGRLVGRGSGTGSGPRTLVHLPTASGAYVLRVGPSSPTAWDASRPYTLRADLVTLSPISLMAVADAYVDQTQPTATHGADRQVIVGVDEFTQERRGLFRFDLSRVPATTIASAYFRVSLYDAASRELNVSLRRVSGAWNEDTVNWNTKPWSVDTGVSAAVGGATGRYYEWDVTALVQSWLTSGVGNFGLELRAVGGPDSRAFRSSEYAAGMFAAPGSGSARTPRLVINFTAPSSGALGSVSGRVYHDADADGRFDAGESGIGGVRVALFRHRVAQGSQMTAADGTYTFSGQPAGEYEASVAESALPAAYTMLSGEYRAFTLAAGAARRDVDFRVAARPTPEPTPPPTLNLTAAGIEFVQVIQGGTLIERKPTLARVYVGVTGSAAEVRGVSGRLYHGFDWIESISPADLLPRADPMHAPDVVSGMNRTLNFLLPDGWTSAGTHDFLAWVNFHGTDRECPGCWNAENQYSTWAHGNSPTFHTAEALNVTMVEVTVNGIAPTVSREDTYRWVLMTYPINTLNVFSDTMSGNYNLMITATTGCGSGWTALLTDLEDTFLSPFGSVGDDGVDMHVFGMIDNAAPKHGNGCGWRPGRAAAGRTTAGSDDGGETMAHEILHNHGQLHTCNACCALNPCTNQHPNGLIGVYGVNLSNPAAPLYMDPNLSYDTMTCGGCGRWPSDITYAFLRGEFNSAAFGAQARTSVVSEKPGFAQEYLVCSGAVVDGQATMRPCYRFTSAAGDNAVGQGPYALELQSAGGATLFTRHFATVGDSADPIAGSGYFRQVVPWQPGTAAIVIRQGQTVLRTIIVSAHAPQVTLLSPNGGEAWPPYGEHTVAWAGSDADGDPLRYILQYSPDGGATWQAVAVNLADTSYALDASRLPGSQQALLRVIVTDGANTGQDASDAAFTVEGKPPAALIVYPVTGQRFKPGQPVILEGSGTDLEDGPLSDDARFRWRSSIEGELGVGRKLFFEDLLPGRHTLTLEVMDSDGFTGGATVEILIGHALYLPLTLH